MPNNEHYLRRVVPQHRHPRFMKWLVANLTPHLDAEKILMGLDDDFDLDNARGVQLDILGQIVGRSRLLSFDPEDGSSPLLDDATYEMLIRAKIGINQWDGTIPGIMALWENLFPDYELFIQDNQNMTMMLYVLGMTTRLEEELILRGYIAPKPMGVRLNVVITRRFKMDETPVVVAGITEHAIKHTATPVERNKSFRHETDATAVIPTGKAVHAIKHTSDSAENTMAESLMYLQLENGNIVSGFVEVDGVVQPGILEII